MNEIDDIKERVDYLLEIKDKYGFNKDVADHVLNELLTIMEEINKLETKNETK